MEIEELECANFVSHKSTKIPFQRGINIIVGPNASGKTSILESISYALVKEYKKGNAEDLIKNGEREMKVKLEFSANGKKWIVQRERKRNGETKSILQEEGDGKFHISSRGERSVTRDIEGIIGLDQSLFLSSMYVRQGELLNLVEATASERKQIIGKLIGIDEIEKAWQNMYDLIRHFKHKKEKVEIELKEKATPTKLKEKKNELTELRESIQKNEARMKHLREESEKVHERLEKLMKKRDEFIKLDQQVKNLKGEVKKKTKQLEEIEVRKETIQKLKKTIQEASNKSEELERRIETLITRLQTLRMVRAKKEELKITYLEERMKGLSKGISQSEEAFQSNLQEVVNKIEPEIHELTMDKVSGIVRKEKKEAKATYKKLRRQLSHLEERGGELHGTLKQKKELKVSTEKAEGKCSVCGSTLSPDHKRRLLKGFKEAIETIEKKINEHKEQLEETKQKLEETQEYRDLLQKINVEVVERQYEELEEKKRKKKETKEKLQNTRGQLETFAANRNIKPATLKELKTQIEEAESNRKSLREKRKELEEKINAIERKKIKKQNELEKKETLNRELRNAKATLKNTKEEKEQLGFNPETYKRIRDDAEAKEKALNNLQGVLKEKRKKKKAVQSEIKQLEKELEEFKRKKDMIQHLEEEYIPFLKKVRRVYHKDKLQKDLREYYRPQIEREMKKIVSNFNLGFTDVELKGDWNISVFGSRGEKSIDMISGGEEVGLSIALRLAIARVLTGKGLNLLILDEPTIYLDDDRIEGLIEVLRSLESIPQVIVVTHNGKLVECADTIFRVRKEGHTSKVVPATPTM